MIIPAIIAPVLEWAGISVASITIGSIFRAVAMWIIRFFTTKILGKVLFFGLFVAAAEFMPNVLVTIFGWIGDAVLMLAAKVGEAFQTAIQNNVDTTEASNLLNENVDAMPPVWKDTMSALNIKPLIGMIVSTYGTLFFIDLTMAIYSAYTFGNSKIVLGPNLAKK